MSEVITSAKARFTQSLNPGLILRLGAGICFIGHGVLAFGAKTHFVALLSTFGISEALAPDVLKVIGGLDVLVGLLILFKPHKLVLRWAMVWTGLTILAWGLHGDSLMDLFRRVPYVTTPLALLVLMYGKQAVTSGKEPLRSFDKLRKLRASSAKKGLPSDGQGTIGTLTISADDAIAAIDLSLISMKLMDREEGEGWSAQQCEEVAREYRRFLKLNMLYPDAKIVPNRAIDAMWHYHILDTEAYYRDCHAVFGHILHHYPYFGMKGKADEKQFFNAFDQTRELYERTFGESMDGPEFMPSFRRQAS